ncbi:guanine nucleotide binding protein, alpha subunit [Lactarius hengduanensis]|nr:guanine nucleotide binding protein, alpha subunit [Lactarius pseudohatsudake]KAH9023314.1 guanine nucleotide binding protein, alpha subunit [Lactarius hengduanensis]
MFRSSDHDPLSAAIAPPSNETPAARTARLRAEAEARRVSEEIDEQLKAERAARRRQRPCVKVLLLGQSESGKSTTLKNFQMQYARETWLEERSSWRAIIQLNLIRSIVTVLDLLGDALVGPALDSPSALSMPLTEKHRLLRLRLAPLRGVQQDLQRRLGAAAIEESYNPGPGGVLPRPSEFAVRSHDGWRSALERFRARPQEAQESARAADARVRKAAEVTEVVVGCAEDMKALWEDHAVREMLRRKKIRMEEEPGFFLNDIERIATRDYEPSDNDVIRARLRTLGVQEYSFWVEQTGHEWLMYDVGGTRSSRAHWYPYFDDMEAIIFLAPISSFDERLREDRRVNRLEDTYMLWQTLCSLQMLSKTQIILFLNKCDLLEQKLRAGVRVRTHVPSFGNRSNDVDTVKKYFQSHFKEIAKQHSPEPRRFYVHLTSVIDTRSTAATLRTVEDGILRASLRRADLL